MASFSCRPLRKTRCFVIGQFQSKVITKFSYKAILKQMFYSFQPWFLEDHEVIVSLVIVHPDISSIFWCPSFDVRLHSSSSIPVASLVECSQFIKIFCHRKYLNHRIVYSSGHQGTFNPAVIKNKEVHMVSNINMHDKTSYTTSNAKKRSLRISDYFSKQKTFFIWWVNSAYNFCYFFLNLSCNWIISSHMAPFKNEPETI